MIQVLEVAKSYAALDGTIVQALGEVSLQVESGQFVSLVGPSGCGKTTLLKIIAGLQKPSQGRVLRDQHLVNGSFGWAGYLSQADTLLPWRTVLANAEIGLEIRQTPPAARRARVAQLIQRVGLAGFEQKYPSELSGGMKKRLGLIRLLSYDPDVLLLDEPFGALDAQTREFLQQDLLTLWQDFHKTVIFVTHDLVEAITLSDRIVLMSPRPGRIKAEYRVDLPRPRRLPDIQFSPAFQELHHQIRLDLHDDLCPGLALPSTAAPAPVQSCA